MIIEGEYEEVEGTEGELDLSEDDSLPWLEADEEDEGSGGIDTAQIVGFALVLLLLLGLIVAGVWYFANRSSGDAQVADGSTIEAPEGPIRERPEDPGGREFDGTGNVAPVVGEGGTREGVMDTDGNSGSGDSAGGEGSEGGSGETTGTAGVGVQLAAYSSRARAEQGWNDLRRRTSALDGARYRIEEGTVDIGTVYRLQAVASDRAAADQLCAALRADGLDCQVKP
ncbi:SPOR domain-containing protein [uncultured Erythrobacter sp.]|uniref:SPOR domain-containing protein n=1 Tax=uncultured Erythrobacter sp. TaxID=263913 RepID=UPI00261AC4C7|nr:SPOR domain-containing protein [uncultured Erythrobacter sp.]